VRKNKKIPDKNPNLYTYILKLFGTVTNGKRIFISAHTQQVES